MSLIASDHFRIVVGLGKSGMSLVRFLARQGLPFAVADSRANPPELATLRAEFNPISDMRASAAYRTEVLGNLLHRFWLESQGLKGSSLETLELQGAAA